MELKFHGPSEFQLWIIFLSILVWATLILA
jgi:hypothetical protein